LYAPGCNGDNKGLCLKIKVIGSFVGITGLNRGVSGEVTEGRREVTRVSVGCWGAGAIGLELSLACFSKSHCRIFRAMVQMMLYIFSNFFSNRAILF
jgi:hypothetical protein